MKKLEVEFNWRHDPSNHKPAYIQIADYMLAKIQSGEWISGAYLPSQRVLAEKIGVNRSTLVAAFDELKAIGLLETYGKGGTRISGQLEAEEVQKAPDWQARISEGFHISNLETIQVINRYEFTEGYVRLSSGEPSPDLFPKDLMAEVMGEMALELNSLGYEEPKGMPLLREAVCEYLLGIGIHTAPENVLIVSGALQAIQLASIGLIQPGATVFLEKPSYLYSLNIFQSIGIRRLGVAMDEQGIITEQIKQYRPKHRQAILYTVPSFHNPTGLLMPSSRRQELADACAKAQVPIIEDDVYRELWLDEPTPAPIKTYDQIGNVLYVGSVSKTLSTGLRIGWMVGPEAVVDRLGDLKMQNDYGSSSLAQIAVAKFLNKGYYHLQAERIRADMRRRRALTQSLLSQYFKDIATWEMPMGGYYFWLTFHESVSLRTLFQEAFRAGVLVYPGYLYDSSVSASLRISFSYATEADLCLGIKKLYEIALRHIG